VDMARFSEVTPNPSLQPTAFCHRLASTLGIQEISAHE
jgi:hypothetical protein